MIGSVIAVVIFLLFVLFAVQLVFGLYARSTVTSVAYSGARSVAGRRALTTGGPYSFQTLGDAEARMRQELGAAGDHADFDWSGSDDDSVSLRVSVDAPHVLAAAYLGPLATDRIERSVRVRLERPR